MGNTLFLMKFRLAVSELILRRAVQRHLEPPPLEDAVDKDTSRKDHNIEDNKLPVLAAEKHTGGHGPSKHFKGSGQRPGQGSIV